MVKYLVFISSDISSNQQKLKRRKRMFRFYHTLVIKCCHSKRLERNWVLPKQTPFPLEIFQLIRSNITDAWTYWSFSEAFDIPICNHLFCQVLAEQKWLEEGGTLLSIGETEYNKVNNDLRYYALLFPTSYKIMLKDQGLAVVTYKKHLVPFNYETFFSVDTLLYTPYIDNNNFEPVEESNSEHHFVHTPHRLIHVYNPNDHKHMLRISTKLPTYIRKKYFEIFNVVKQSPSKTIRIEPWTMGYHEKKKKLEPCQDWIDYLMQLYTFQQENSIVLKQYKQRVS